METFASSSSDYKCDICEYYTVNQRELDEHMVTLHLKFEEYPSSISDCVRFSRTVNYTLLPRIEEVDNKDQFFDRNIVHKMETFAAKIEGNYNVEKMENIDIRLVKPEINSESASSSSDYKCDICEYCSVYKPEFEEHMRTVHLKIEKYPFSVNKCVPKSENAITTCADNVVKLKIKKNRCSYCEYATASKRNLERHVNGVHLKLKSHRCTQCEYAAITKNKLKQHVDAVHLKIRRHRCTECDYAAGSKSDLTLHVNSVHLCIKNHRCTMCDYNSATKGNIITHMKTVHLRTKEHFCTMCEYAAVTKHNLKRHINAVHLNIREHSCDLCEYVGGSKYKLKRHVDTVHLKIKDHFCTMCGYAAGTKARVERHIDTVHSKNKNHPSDMGNDSTATNDQLHTNKNHAKDK